MSKSSVKRLKRETYTHAYNRYYPYIFNIVYSKTGNEYDSADICQEVFLVFFNKFDEIIDHRKWLLGTMRNIVLAYIKKKSSPETDIDAVFNDISLSYVNGFREIRIIINEAVDNTDISDEEKLLIEYIAYNNYSYKLAGTVMGLTKKQAVYKYSIAVKKILKYLRDKGIHNIEDLL